MADPFKQNNEHLWYPLVAVPENLIIAFFSIPGVVPRRDQMKAGYPKDLSTQSRRPYKFLVQFLNLYSESVRYSGLYVMHILTAAVSEVGHPERVGQAGYLLVLSLRSLTAPMLPLPRLAAPKPLQYQISVSPRWAPVLLLQYTAMTA
ncbi:hypothetical protein BDN70DRAFT_994561 [Pholiota conissans]|uniref:Uncharacterized protein n=1 Tax=Pholiota conissans TaxID=109636 RepID=A0A9P6CS88_9AGAR|nr:hypothetical protein BDN70DRAFT_994561 [Pholiota conissans]